MIRILIYSVLICSGSLLISCKANKTLLRPLNEEIKESLLSTIQHGQFSFDYFSSKAKVRLQSEELSGAGKMNIRMVRDSIIWFNFKKVSIEGARGIITPDEYSLIYRREKKYEQGSLQDFAEHFGIPLDFSVWQDYLAGNVPQLDREPKASKSKSQYLISGESNKLRIVYFFDDHLELTKYELTDSQNRTLAVELSQRDDDLGIYKRRKLNYFNKEKAVTTLELELSDIEINVPKKIHFSIPDHYSRI